MQRADVLTVQWASDAHQLQRPYAELGSDITRYNGRRNSGEGSTGAAAARFFFENGHPAFQVVQQILDNRYSIVLAQLVRRLTQNEGGDTPYNGQFSRETRLFCLNGVGFAITVDEMENRLTKGNFKLSYPTYPNIFSPTLRRMDEVG